tara:strand:- start:578 stop:1621 length:1044 start_codon:yes stop_codon:yes gene_type:complete
METIKTDVTIVGAGPVGLFSVFELGLLGFNAHVIDSLGKVGGQCSTLYPDKPIYDIPGIPLINAQELIDQLLTQAGPFNPTFHLNQKVTHLEQLEDKSFILKTSLDTVFYTKTVILAAGLGAFRERPLRLPGIAQFVNTNLHYSVKDINQFKDQKIVILGGGDSAIDWALSISNLCSSLTLVHRREEFRAVPSSIEQMKKLADKPNSNVRYMIGKIADYTHTDGSIISIDVKAFGKNSHKETISLDHLLVFYGLSPDLGPIADWGLNLDKRNIEANPQTLETNISGVFAIGDINSYPGKKKLILCGFHEAALAAYSIQKYLDPNTKQRVQYTTTSSMLQERLGVTKN